jgi:hypothetical protein
MRAAVGQDGSPAVVTAIRGLHDRITRYTDQLVAALRADPDLAARVQPTWDQAVQPFLDEWNALWSMPAQWTWAYVTYFTKRWNTVADLVGNLLPYTLRSRLERETVVSGERGYYRRI